MTYELNLELHKHIKWNFITQITQIWTKDPDTCKEKTTTKKNRCRPKSASEEYQDAKDVQGREIHKGY